MAAWLEHAECQLQAVDQVFFAVCVCSKILLSWDGGKSSLPHSFLFAVIPGKPLL